MYKTYAGCLMSIALMFTSCTSFREINKYASTSVEFLNNFNALDYSYTKYCLRDCELQQIRAEKLDTFFTCKCMPLATRADDAMLKIHTTLTTYLQAIQHLTDNTNFNYNVSGLTAALQANPQLQLSQQQADIITKAGNFIANAATSIYRRRKLGEFLNASDSLFQDLITTFRYLVNDRLRKQLRIDYETRYTNLKQKIADTDQRGLKQLLVGQSLVERQDYTRRLALINQYVALLEVIKDSHHNLYLKRNSLKTASTSNTMKLYTDQIKDLLATLKITNN